MLASVLLNAKKLTRIPYADKPLPQLKSDDAITYLTPVEFQQKFNIQYSESLFGNKEDIADTLANPQLLEQYAAGRHDTPHEAAVIERMHQPLDCFIICNMGPDVGYGLFTLNDIPANTVLFLFAGELADPVSYSLERNSDYSWLSSDEDPTKVINPSHVGGLARFMQHLPMDYTKHKAMIEEVLRQHITENPEYTVMMQAENITISDFIDNLLQNLKQEDEAGKLHFHNTKLKENLMTSNVNLCTVVVRGVPAVVVTTTQAIAANTQLGFSYGKQYWLMAQQQPRYFYTDGSLVPLSTYRNAFYQELNNAQPLLSGIVQPKQPTPRQLYDKSLALYKEEKAKEEAEKNYSRAIETLELAITAYQQQEQKEEELATCYNTLATFYKDNGDISQAIEACQIALTLREKLVIKNETVRPQLEKTQTKLAELTQLLKPKP